MLRGDKMHYTVVILWDDEANVWIATSPDITGLVLESESLDTLMSRVQQAAPELLAINKQKPAKTISYVCNRTQSMAYA